MKKILFVAGILMASSAFGMSKKDREIADEFLKMESTINFIEADPDLKKLSPEEMYERLEKDGIIEGIKTQRAREKYIKEHPDYHLLEEQQKKRMEDLLQNETGVGPQLPSCVAKRQGTFLTYIGPPSVAPWHAVFPLMECVDVAKKNGGDPKKCIIAGCTPMYSMPSSKNVAEMVRDILLGYYN